MSPKRSFLVAILFPNLFNKNCKNKKKQQKHDKAFSTCLFIFQWRSNESSGRTVVLGSLASLFTLLFLCEVRCTFNPIHHSLIC